MHARACHPTTTRPRPRHVRERALNTTDRPRTEPVGADRGTDNMVGPRRDRYYPCRVKAEGLLNMRVSLAITLQDCDKNRVLISKMKSNRQRTKSKIIHAKICEASRRVVICHQMHHWTDGRIMDGWERREAVIRHARESGDDVAAAADGVKETTTRDGQAEGEREREWQALHR